MFSHACATLESCFAEQAHLYGFISATGVVKYQIEVCLLFMIMNTSNDCLGKTGVSPDLFGRMLVRDNWQYEVAREHASRNPDPTLFQSSKWPN